MVEYEFRETIYKAQFSSLKRAERAVELLEARVKSGKYFCSVNEEIERPILVTKVRIGKSSVHIVMLNIRRWFTNETIDQLGER